MRVWKLSKLSRRVTIFTDSDPDSGSFYTQLGAAHSVSALRTMMEKRTGLQGGQVRFEKIIYTGREGKTAQGCPIAKWVKSNNNNNNSNKKMLKINAPPFSIFHAHNKNRKIVAIPIISTTKQFGLNSINSN